MFRTWMTEEFKIKYPIIMAPMFLISNFEMMKAAQEAGIMGCLPALNFRTPEEFRAAAKNFKKSSNGAWGVNLIVNKSNIYINKQIDVCAEERPDFIITSLGSPKDTISKLKPLGIKTFCDVVDLSYAKKVEDMGADALIAVNSGAGGHAGNIPAGILVPILKLNTKLPVISAGGIGNGIGLLSILSLGADGVSMGSPFIATHESPVNKEYKQACVDYSAKDIVFSTKISGTPCTVINTPYVKQIGTEQNFLESYLSKNKQLKKYAKMLTSYRGMKLLEKAAFGASYKTVWCAGPSIEFTKEITSVKTIVDQMIEEFKLAKIELDSKLL